MSFNSYYLKKCLIKNNKDLNIYNRVPIIHKQPATPHIANDAVSNCSIHELYCYGH
jgi:hypothetical protein